MCRVCVLQRRHSGGGCDLASTLCTYDLRKGDVFVLSWARVRRVSRGSISSEEEREEIKRDPWINHSLRNYIKIRDNLYAK